MTATLTTTTVPSTAAVERPAPSLWRTGAVAGGAAAATTVAVAAAGQALGASLETAPGEAIPLFAFAQLTLMCVAVGVVLARALCRRARRPGSTFVRATVVLTAVSIVPDIALSTDVATKVTLVLTHLVAAAIVIPALSSRLPARAAGCA